MIKSFQQLKTKEKFKTMMTVSFQEELEVKKSSKQKQNLSMQKVKRRLKCLSNSLEIKQQENFSQKTGQIELLHLKTLKNKL